MGATQGRKDGPQEKDPAIFFKAGITQKQKRENKLKKGTPHAIPDSSCVGLIQKMVVGGAISPKTGAPPTIKLVNHSGTLNTFGKMDYWININGQQSGPYSYEQIQQSLAEGRISYNDYIWTAESNAWVTIQEKPEFAIQPVNLPSPSLPKQGAKSAGKKMGAVEIFGRCFAAFVGLLFLGVFLFIITCKNSESFRGYLKERDDEYKKNPANWSEANKNYKKKLAIKKAEEERLAQVEEANRRKEEERQRRELLKVTLQLPGRLSFSDIQELQGEEHFFVIECLGEPTRRGRNDQGHFYLVYEKPWDGVRGLGGSSFIIYTQKNPKLHVILNPVIGFNFD